MRSNSHKQQTKQKKPQYPNGFINYTEKKQNFTSERHIPQKKVAKKVKNYKRVKQNSSTKWTKTAAKKASEKNKRVWRFQREDKVWKYPKIDAFFYADRYINLVEFLVQWVITKSAQGYNWKFNYFIWQTVLVCEMLLTDVNMS